MRTLYLKALAAALAAAFVSTQTAAAQTRSGASSLRSASKNPIGKKGVGEPAAIEALKSMSAYLTKATTLAFTSQGSLDVVTGDGQRIQLDGTTQYKIRRPGFVIDYASDMKSRRFIYDGKNFTVYSPKLGYYATVAAPSTNREALDSIYKKFGIALPLEDLFRWGEGASADRLRGMKSAYDIGTATIEG